MKLKKLIATTLVLTSMFSLTAFAEGDGVHDDCDITLTQSNQIYDIVGQGDDHADEDSIIISKGTLTKDGQRIPSYLVTVYGMNNDKTNSNNLASASKAMAGKDSVYLQDVLNAIKNNIPKDSNILLAGGSLGGMIVQQVAANAEIKNNYNIINTLTFGSPYIKGSIEGTLVRQADKSDIIPFLCVNNIFSYKKYMVIENGGYKFGDSAAHGWSYARSDVWGAYDVLGVKNGTSTFTLNFTKQIYVKATPQ